MIITYYYRYPRFLAFTPDAEEDPADKKKKKNAEGEGGEEEGTELANSK